MFSTFYQSTCFPVYDLLLHVLAEETIEHARELHREDVLGGRA